MRLSTPRCHPTVLRGSTLTAPVARSLGGLANTERYVQILDDHTHSASSSEVQPATGSAICVAFPPPATYLGNRWPGDDHSCDCPQSRFPYPRDLGTIDIGPPSGLYHDQ
jgi:hypothetical protein